MCDSNAHMLRTLCCLYGVFGIVQHAGEFTLVSAVVDICTSYVCV